MSDTPRKTLRLPGKPEGSEAAPASERRPLRATAPRQRPKVGAALSSPPADVRKPPAAPRAGQKAAPARPAKPAFAKPPLVRVRPEPAASSAPKNVQAGERISKLMAARGMCSRREADSYIERGWVFVNGERVTELGTRTDASAAITLDRQAQATQQRQMTILLNKPVGYVSGQPEPGFTPAATLILPENQYQTSDTPIFSPSCLQGLAPAGRLDIDSTGLLVLTQDGRVARQLIGEHSTVDKEYLVRVEGRLDAKGLGLLNHGLSLDGRQLKPAKVEWLNEDQLRFILNEGRKRQIRRMCELVGLRVVGLKRVRIGRVKLGDLPLGQWRFLSASETF